MGKGLVWAAVVCLILIGAAAAGAQTGPRVLVLGFDGMFVRQKLEFMLA